MQLTQRIIEVVCDGDERLLTAMCAKVGFGEGCGENLGYEIVDGDFCSSSEVFWFR